MEILGDINDITIFKGKQHKIKVRVCDEKNMIIDKLELVINKKGKITVQ